MRQVGQRWNESQNLIYYLLRGIFYTKDDSGLFFYYYFQETIYYETEFSPIPKQQHVI